MLTSHQSIRRSAGRAGSRRAVFIACGLTLLATVAAARAQNVPQTICRPALIPPVVEVAHEGLRLSDLLPSCTPPEVRARAELISLGYAPNQSEMREISQYEVSKQLAADPLLEANIRVGPSVFVTRWTPPPPGSNSSGVPQDQTGQNLSVPGTPLFCHAGDVRTAEFDLPHQRVLLPVRCLEDGRAGNSVRVKDLVSGRVLVLRIGYPAARKEDL